LPLAIVDLSLRASHEMTCCVRTRALRAQHSK
jgi:hypothetical protein